MILRAVFSKSGKTASFVVEIDESAEVSDQLVEVDGPIDWEAGQAFRTMYDDGRLGIPSRSNPWSFVDFMLSEGWRGEPSSFTDWMSKPLPEGDPDAIP